jgi:predicted nucleic acid-binding protein
MLVLDANILIRAVLGSRVLSLLTKYGEQVDFMAPETAFQEASEVLPAILERRNVPVPPAMAILNQLADLIQTVEAQTYRSYESIARERIAYRDEDDWPVLAAALALDSPIWTEDTDFFGCGVATWTTDRVELYLAKAAQEERRTPPSNLL